MQLKERLGFAGTAVAVAIASATAAVIAHRMGFGHGAGLAACVAGGLGVAASVIIFHRAMRRRARLESIVDLLPRYRPRRVADEFAFDEAEIENALSDRLPAARADMRAATRALLVSLEEELANEAVAARRTSRPACRRARLRVAGRARPRRRAPVRLAANPS